VLRKRLGVGEFLYYVFGILYVESMGQGGQEIDLVSEEFGQVVGWSVAPIYHWSDGLVFFMDLYEFLDGGGRWVHIYVFPFVIFGDEGFALFHHVSDLGLEGVGRV
jgi:hypothetical protein